jgi:hypothetical protein
VTLAVYAITPASARLPAATGMRREPLRLYRAGALAAVAGDIRGVPAATPDSLRMYDGTVRRLAASLPALLPVRFGTCVTDADDLRAILRSRERSLRRALAHVRHRVQMTVRLLADTGEADTESGPTPSRSDSAAPASADARGGGAVRPSAGTLYLRERADAARRARHVAEFEPIRSAVERWVRDERIERQGPKTSVYHLIPRAAASAYERAALRRARSMNLRIVVTGPWPPYAFVEAW